MSAQVEHIDLKLKVASSCTVSYLLEIEQNTTVRLYTIGGLDWWTGLVDWTTGLIDFYLKCTLEVL